MKLGQGHVFRQQRKNIKQQQFTHYFKILVLCVGILVFAMTFSYVSAAPSRSEGGKVSERTMRVPTTGKAGVSSPAKSSMKHKASKSKNSQSGTDTSTLPSVSIPAKPAWVNKPLFTDPTNSAAQYLAANPTVAGAKYIAQMAKMPVAQWFGDWNADVESDVNTYVSAAAAKGSVPVVVVYNIPHRDCGGYSVGGANGLTIYTQWIKKVTAGIGDRTAVVILEPDALGALDCLPTSLQEERSQSLANAVTILKAHAQTTVYIDAGTPVWQPATVMASRLKSANVAEADGFSLNVSYFATTTLNRTYGNQLSSLIGYKHYVIDVSRNGGNHAVTGMQCNPSFASFGSAPTTNTGSNLNDALLWIKIPWESDGPCNGSPAPGVSYWSYATKLAQNAGW